MNDLDTNTLSECGSFLRKHHVRVTPQRLIVYATLHDSHQHSTVNDIFQKVKKSIPSISLATVYSILNSLKEVGLVRELTIEPERSVYDAGVHLHNHFLCKKCNKIFDIPPQSTSSELLVELDGHCIHNFEIYFYGHCKICSQKANEKKET